MVTAWVSHKLCSLHPLYKGGDRFDEMVTCLSLGIENGRIMLVSKSGAMLVPRYWLAEYFNLLEKLPRFLRHSESLSLLHACVTWILHLLLIYDHDLSTCTTRDRWPWAAAEDMSSVAYAKLATMAVEYDERLWVLRPKLHAAGLHIYTCMYTCM